MPKFTKKKATLADITSEAFGEITTLAEEMREAYDNTPESLQQSAVGEARGEAADILAGINEVELETEYEELGKIEAEYSVLQRTPSQLRRLSRRERRDDATSLLSTVIEELQKACDDEKRSQDIRDAASAAIDELENAKDEADGVAFPGMRG